MEKGRPPEPPEPEPPGGRPTPEPASSTATPAGVGRPAASAPSASVGRGLWQSLWLLVTRRYLAARPAAALATVAVLWGWGAAQYPWILEDVASIEDYAASDPVLWGLVGAFVLAAALVVPSLFWMYRLTETRALDAGELRPDSTEALLERSRGH